MKYFSFVLLIFVLVLSGCPEKFDNSNVNANANIYTNVNVVYANDNLGVISGMKIFKIKTDDGYLYVTIYDTVYGGGCSQTMVPFK